MRLEPVFVVAPKATSPSMSTRRAFLLASGTFAAGATLGGACGYAMGSQAPADGGAGAASPSADPAADESPKPSGDVELDELRRLAVKAPIEELVKQRPIFLTYFGRRYRKDEILWRGVDRLCQEVLKRPDYPNRLLAANGLVQVVEQGEPGLKELVGDKVQALRSIK